MIFQKILLSSSLDDTPESLYVVDRLTNFNYGYHGDIELYDDPVLLAMREIEQRVEHALLHGTGV